MAKIIIEKIKVKDLYKYASTVSKTNNGGLIPITKHRAVSHQKNPYAAPSDIGLFVAKTESYPIGFIGTIPANLKGGKRNTKIQWLTTWYVAPKYRKTGIGTQLLITALSQKYDSVVSGASEEADKIYFSLIPRHRELNFYLLNFDRLNLFEYILPKKLSDQLYKSAKKLYYNLVLASLEKNLEEINYHEIDETDKNAFQKAKFEIKSPYFPRGTDILNWMLKYPWIRTGKREKIDNYYPFSSKRPIFKYITLKINDKVNEKYKGFFLLSVSSERDRVKLKVLDMHLGRQDFKYTIALVLKYAQKYQAHYIEFPEKLASQLHANLLVRSLIRKKKHNYFFHPRSENSHLARTYKKISLSYPDGEIAFT